MENKKPLLVAKDISISFGALKAVNNFNLEINSGELIGLIGPNGAGKTTVFNILTGVYNASSGKYILDGENVIKTSTSALVKKGLARTFQNIRLFKYLSVLDNVVAAYNFRMKYGILSGMLRLPSYWKEEKEAKEAVKQGVDKISTDRDVAIIALVSSLISSLVVGVVISFFFTRKNKQSFFSKKYVMKMIIKSKSQFSFLRILSLKNYVHGQGCL